MIHGQAGRPGVFLVRHHGHAVVRHFELVPVHAILGALDNLFVLDGARRVLNIGLTVAEPLEAATGAGDIDAYLDAWRSADELFRHRLGQRANGRRAVRCNAATQRAQVRVLRKGRGSTQHQASRHQQRRSCATAPLRKSQIPDHHTPFLKTVPAVEPAPRAGRNTGCYPGIAHVQATAPGSYATASSRSITS